MQDDMKKMQADIETLKQNGNNKPKKRKLTSQEQYELFMGLANLLDDDEKEALGKYMEAEEARKVALYGWLLFGFKRRERYVARRVCGYTTLRNSARQWWCIVCPVNRLLWSYSRFEGGGQDAYA